MVLMLIPGSWSNVNLEWRRSSWLEPNIPLETARVHFVRLQHFVYGKHRASAVQTA